MTRYALYAAMEMASAGDSLVTVTDIAKRYDISEAALAKVFQQLVRAGLAIGTRGAGGGYRLVRRPAELTVLEVIEAFEPPRQDGSCLLGKAPDRDCSDQPDCRLRQLFDEVDEVARATFASVSLETLVR